MTDTLMIGEGTQVTLHFALKLEAGEVVDTDSETFVIPPEKGFGQANPNNIQEFKRETFAEDLTLEKGLMLSFADAQNAELPGVVTDFNDDKVTVDFNHPLAGKPINFEVKILQVDPAVKH